MNENTSDYAGSELGKKQNENNKNIDPRKGLIKVGKHYQNFCARYGDLPDSYLKRMVEYFLSEKKDGDRIELTDDTRITIAVPIGTYGTIGLSYQDCRLFIRGQIGKRLKEIDPDGTLIFALERALKLRELFAPEEKVSIIGTKWSYALFVSPSGTFAQEVVEAFSYDALRHSDVEMIDLPVEDIHNLSDWYKANPEKMEVE